MSKPNNHAQKNYLMVADPEFSKGGKFLELVLINVNLDATEKHFFPSNYKRNKMIQLKDYEIGFMKIILLR